MLSDLGYSSLARAEAALLRPSRASGSHHVSQAQQKFCSSSGVRRGLNAVATLLVVAAASFGVGCGNTLYAISANSASSKVEEARELGAEEYAPYEYYYAQAHLEKAKREAAEADYGDATNLADEAEEYADKAIRLSRDARRGAGR